jgi:tetratricopeptide (TPR) repeat protein
LAAAGWLVYAPALHGRWLWDDDRYITQNPRLTGPGGLAGIWFAPTGVNYFPVTATVQWLQWRAWGDDPFGFHVTNVALHVLSGLLLWRLLRRLDVRLAWLGGLLWVVHPLAVESVAWISELKNTLSLPLLLVALIGFLNFDDRERAPGSRRAWYFLSLACFLASMLSKSVVAMFPGILLLHAGWKRRRIGGADLRAALPFGAVSLALGLVTVAFEHRAIGAGAAWEVAPAARAADAGLALAFYAWKCALPFGLLPIYPRWDADPAALAPWLAWLGLAALLALLWSRRATGGTPVLFGLGCFILMLLPILGFAPMAYQRLSWVADHFAYAALPAAIGLATAGAGVLQSRVLPGRRWVAPAAALVAVVLGVLSRRQAGYFRDEATLWGYTLRHNPGAWMAHNNLGVERLKAGDFAAALAEFTAAARLDPSAPEARANLGVALADLGRMNEAAAQGEAAVRLAPGYAEAHHKLGDILVRAGRTDEGVEQYRQALRLNPDDAEAQGNLGIAWFDQGNGLAQAGRTGEAVAAYERALQLKPDFPDAEVNLGNALYRLRRPAEAADHYRAAIRLRPDYAGAHYNLGLVLRALGRAAEADAEFAAARRLESGQ